MKVLIGIFFLALVASCNLEGQIDLGQGFVLKNSTPTINTIGKPLGDGGGGQIRMIRGDIKKYYFDSRIIAGYLSIKSFPDDGLLGLESENDKEGYFIIFKDMGNIISGLTKENFQKKLRAERLSQEVNFIDNS